MALSPKIPQDAYLDALPPDLVQLVVPYSVRPMALKVRQDVWINALLITPLVLSFVVNHVVMWNYVLMISLLNRIMNSDVLIHVTQQMSVKTAVPIHQIVWTFVQLMAVLAQVDVSMHVTPMGDRNNQVVRIVVVRHTHHSLFQREHHSHHPPAFRRQTLLTLRPSFVHPPELSDRSLSRRYQQNVTNSQPQHQNLSLFRYLNLLRTTITLVKEKVVITTLEKGKEVTTTLEKGKEVTITLEKGKAEVTIITTAKEKAVETMTLVKEEKEGTIITMVAREVAPVREGTIVPRQ
jgi:hypothetical protein